MIELSSIADDGKTLIPTLVNKDDIMIVADVSQVTLAAGFPAGAKTAIRLRGSEPRDAIFSTASYADLREILQ